MTNAIEAEIKRTAEALRGLFEMRPALAARQCRDIIQYESVLRSERKSLRGRLKWLQYFNHLAGGNESDSAPTEDLTDFMARDESETAFEEANQD